MLNIWTHEWWKIRYWMCEWVGFPNRRTPNCWLQRKAWTKTRTRARRGCIKLIVDKPVPKKTRSRRQMKESHIKRTRFPPKFQLRTTLVPVFSLLGVRCEDAFFSLFPPFPPGPIAPFLKVAKTQIPALLGESQCRSHLISCIYAERYLRRHCPGL